MTLLTPPAYLQPGTYTALLDRQYINTVPTLRDFTVLHRARQGFLPSRTPTYTNPSALNISVSACAGIIANTFATDAGEYKFANPSATQVTLAAASLTQNRIDVVGFAVKDNTYDSSGLNSIIPAVVQGTYAAGAPSAPALPASFIPVVQVLVNANATTPTSMTSRIQRTAMEGAPLLVGNATERDALGTPYAGFMVDRMDRNWLERHDGSAYRVLGTGVAICTTTGDRNTAISNPITGELAIATVNRQVYQYDGAAWIPLGQVAGRLTTATTIGTTSGTTELDLPKLAITGQRVKAGGWYILNLALSAQFGAGNDSFVIRVRRTTALSGSIVADFSWIGDVGGYTHSINFALPVLIAADDNAASFHVSVQRQAGVGVMTVNGLSRSAFWIDDRGGDSAVWSTVA